MIENFINKYIYYNNVSLKKYNTYKISSFARYLIYPRNEEELLNLIVFLRGNKEDFIILGGGSNVILARNKYNVVIKLDYLNNIYFDDNIVTVGSGVSIIKLARICMEKGLDGLAFAGSIPALVGSCAVCNTGAFNESMSDIVKSVKVITPSNEIKILDNNDLEYTYRDSMLKKNKGYIVTEVILELRHGDSEKIREVMVDRRNRRMSSQPLDMPSAGSVFRNPDGMSAGKLIDDANLKGYRIGDAMVSQKHANFIVNSGNATASDIISLIDYTKRIVKENNDIDLILEQEIIR